MICSQGAKVGEATTAQRKGSRLAWGLSCCLFQDGIHRMCASLDLEPLLFLQRKPCLTLFIYILGEWQAVCICTSPCISSALFVARHFKAHHIQLSIIPAADLPDIYIQ